MKTDIIWASQAQPWSSEMHQKILTSILELKATLPGPHYVAFDADGTLWADDIGESFFDYQIDHEVVPLPEDPFDHYMELKKKHPPLAYHWLAALCAGHSLDEVMEWAENAYVAHRPRVFVPMFSLIQELKENGIFTVVVSASVKWSVIPGAERLGVQTQHVFGVETKVIDGIVTDQADGFMTWREGKAESLLKTFGVGPLFACGNSDGDLHLLESSRGLRLAVQSASEQTSLGQNELKMRELALSNGWLVHDYSNRELHHQTTPVASVLHLSQK